MDNIDAKRALESALEISDIHAKAARKVGEHCASEGAKFLSSSWYMYAYMIETHATEVRLALLNVGKDDSTS